MSSESSESLDCPIHISERLTQMPSSDHFYANAVNNSILHVRKDKEKLTSALFTVSDVLFW